LPRLAQVNDQNQQTKTRKRRKALSQDTPPEVAAFLHEIDPKRRRAKGRPKEITVKRYSERLDIAPQGNYKLDGKTIKLNAPPEPSSLYNCVRGYIEGHTSDKIFHKAVTCGKENCPTCGADYSVIHNRRINRAYPKILQLSAVGYLIVTVPKELRNAFLDKRVLCDFRNFVRRKLKRDYNTRGLIRYHWCGEDGHTWKPHLNVLLEGKFWAPEKLEAFRNAVALWFVNYFELTEPVPGNIYYAYVNPLTFKTFTDRETGETIAGPEAAKRKIKHWVKYVLRATAKKVWDHKILDVIRGYNNTGYFGKFDKVEKERDAASAILAGCDPETGEIIRWCEMVKPSTFNVEYRRHAREIVNDENPERVIYYGLYVTHLIDLIPAGVQLAISDAFSNFEAKPPPV
jgi:hypothetical protein